MSNIVLYNPNAVVPNQVTQYVTSVNTPDYDSDPNKVINPDISSVISVLMKYWVVSGNDVLEMDQTQKDAIDAALLPGVKTTQKNYLFSVASNMTYSQGYVDEVKHNLLSMYADSIRIKPNRTTYLQPWVDWMRSIDQEIKTKQTAVDAAITIAEAEAITIDTATLISTDPGITLSAALAIVDSSDLSTFLDANAEVTDPDTNLKGPFYLMQELQHRKDLYNDVENPIYKAGHVPILGATGILQDHADRVLNLETIHGKLGWHNQEIVDALYKKPKDLLIYYGYPNSFNSATNGWYNEKVARDMCKYDMIILGDGVEAPTHPDYANTQIIIPRIKVLNPSTLIFGYVATAQILADFQTKVDQWDTLSVHGIFMDEAGYDYGKTREEFNTCVDYIHGKTNAKLAFANAWNIDHILGTADDVSFPNATFNPTTLASHLTSDDWVLLESFLINTTAYSGDNGYESKTDWLFRGQKAVNLRAVYGTNFAASAIINNDNVNGESLFNAQYISALMFSLEAVGSSDVSYASSSAAVNYWPHPDISDINTIYSLSPSVSVSTLDADVYLRYIDSTELLLDFSAGAQICNINRYGNSYNIFCLLSTTTGINGKTIADTNLYTVPLGKTAIITSAIIRPVVATAVTVVPTLGMGRNASSDDIYASISLTGLNATTKNYKFISEGTYATAASGEIIKLGIDTGATATTLTLTVNLFGYLI